MHCQTMPETIKAADLQNKMQQAAALKEIIRTAMLRNTRTQQTDTERN